MTDTKVSSIFDRRSRVEEFFTFLQNPKNFAKVRVSEYGHSIEWINEKGEEVDFGADTLRSKAENQARLNEVASVLQY